MDTVAFLECSATGKRYEPGEVHGVSEAGKPLLVRYDLDAVAGTLHKDTLAARPSGLWRYRELLPVRDDANVVGGAVGHR